MEEVGEDCFVSISLEPCESCGLCGLDTGEPLVKSCQLCIRKSTQGPFQKGFNRVPDMPHSGMVAHESCLADSHQALKQARPSFHSPLLHRRGISVPNDVKLSSKPDSPTNSDKLKNWMINHARNESIKNRQNRLQVHSSPSTRSSSPDIFRAWTEEALLRRNSENNLKDPSYMELRRSYAKYLYGNKVPKSLSDESVRLHHSNPNLSIIDDSDSDGSQSCLLDTGVPSWETYTKQRSLDAEDNKKKTTLSRDSKKLVSSVKEGKKTDSQLWSNKEKIDIEYLNKMSAAEVKKVVSSLESMIKGISAQLVDLLQERDDLGQEVRHRNVTIQKLVKMKHSQQDATIKTTGVGNI